MDISVIVPIYGVENYIEKCLRSLFEQTKTDGVEFILVNDCTPDNSMAIARKVICEYPHLTIKVLEHAENRGVAATRQTGLDAAIGDYTIQIDSDDWCELNMLEEMYAKAIEENADIVACDHFDFEGKVVRNIHSEDKLENVDKLLSIFFSTLWSRLIKHDLYIKHNIKCDNGINNGEDTLIMPMLYYVADKIAYHPQAYVHYNRFNTGSITSTCEIQCFVSNYVKIFCIWAAFFKATPDYSKFKASIEDRKLVEKHNVLKRSRGKAQKECNKQLPIKSRDIFRSKKIYLTAKITLFLAGIGLLPVSNFLYYLGDKLHGHR